jgi:hypothetical protein
MRARALLRVLRLSSGMKMRTTMPGRRYCETLKLHHGSQRAAYHVTVGYYADRAAPGEIFISTNKIGTAQDALARDIAILMSLALQHGCALATMRDALTREADGTPSTIAGAVADRLTEAPA